MNSIMTICSLWFFATVNVRYTLENFVIKSYGYSHYEYGHVSGVAIEDVR